MNLLEKLFPQWGLKRRQAHNALKAYYEAAESSIYRKQRTDRGSGDATVKKAGDKLRIQARHLEQNHDLAKGVIDTLVANIVGTGVRPEPQVKTASGELADDINTQLLKLWNNWIRNPEVTGEMDFYAAQRLACRTWVRDGEVFTQMVSGTSKNIDHVSEVPFSIELIEPDLVPIDYDDIEKGIVQGVKKNKWGKPTQYFVYKEHPSDSMMFQSYTDLKTIRSESMLHLKLVNRIRQTRGVSMLAPVITRLDDIKDIEESERIAAKVASAMTGYIKKGTPDMYIPAYDEGYREVEFEAGMIFDDLLVGEDVGTIASNRPNNQLIPFRDSMMRAVAAGTNTGYSTISKNYNGTYAAQRQELVEQYGVYGMLWSQFCEQWVRKIWDGFVEMALLTGKIQGQYDPTTITDVELSRPALPWIDPFKEATASERLVAGGFASRSQIIRSHGKNPDEVMRQIIKERNEAEEAGVVFSTDQGKIVQPQQQVSEDNTNGDKENQDDDQEQ